VPDPAMELSSMSDYECDISRSSHFKVNKNYELPLGKAIILVVPSK
jgi:hypothetical protein